MKRFLCKVIIAMIPIVIAILPRWFYVWRYPMKYMDGEYPYWMQQKHYINKRGSADNIIALGDSTMKAAIRPLLAHGTKIANLALGGGTTVESYYALKTYIKNHGTPDAVIMGYHMVHYVANECNITRTLYFNYLDPLQILAVRCRASRLKDPYWGAPSIDDKIVKYKLRIPNMYKAALEKSVDGKRYAFNQRKYQKTADERGYMHFGTRDGFYGKSYIARWKDFKANELIDLYLHRIIDLCIKRGIPLIIVQMPIESASAPFVDVSVLQKIEQYFEALQEEYPTCDIHTKMVWFDNSLFGDGNHLNASGAKEFTAKVLKDLRQANALKHLH